MINGRECFKPGFDDNHKERSLGLVHKSSWSQLGPQAGDCWRCESIVGFMGYKDCYLGLAQIKSDHIWIGPSVFKLMDMGFYA